MCVFCNSFFLHIILAYSYNDFPICTSQKLCKMINYISYNDIEGLFRLFEARAQCTNSHVRRTPFLSFVRLSDQK